ncbi:MAG: amino acid adenylation domain-containing protein [Acidobacteriota bacterium]
MKQAYSSSNGLRAAIRLTWQNLLGVSALADDTNVFDLGATSLQVLRFVSQIQQQTGLRLAEADVYDRPTVAGMAQCLAPSHTPDRPAPPAAPAPSAAPTQGMAIIGMAVRVGDARDVDSFWANLLADRSSIRHFSDAELDPQVPASLRARPNFVAARGVIDEVDRFDAAFFGISAREATITDPQQRLFLELCWSALEHAAIDPARSHELQGTRIGVYGGTANNTYLPALQQAQPGLLDHYGEFPTSVASEKDYVTTRVANRLNLHGPAISIHTACSTSLVAITQAWHALAQGQCDVALAGGVTVIVPQAGGYLHVEGGMESADGLCRPFDAQASGTVFSNGGAVVVLKRLEQAQHDGDTIYGVIKGVGLNNDGGEKASFTAPSVSGQAEAIRMALSHAGVSARSIGYMEAHGTGTALGDPIEVSALTRAWAGDTADTQFCELGSVKGHVGHTIAAAGALGLIKATLALHHEVIPGTLHFGQANPHIDFARTPFFVSAQARAWPRGPQVRRAAVSSFGVGGTNAHVVVEEAPATPRRLPTHRPGQWHVLPLSARHPDALLQRAQDLARHLKAHPHLPWDSVMATLVRGRQAMPYRATVVAQDLASAAEALAQVKTAIQATPQARLVFLFPGQGSQHPGMARQLCESSPAFAQALERCLAAAPAELAQSLRVWLTQSDPGDAQAAAQLAETRHAQPALFCVSYALAAWLDSLGVRPAAMIGHSIGEYAAACHAGVLSVEEAMRAVVARGQAMFAQPDGTMLAVRASAEQVARLLPAGVEVAAANAPGLTVVAGPHAAIAAWAAVLEAQDIGTTRLKVSHAFHSASMEGALPAVAQALSACQLHPPATPVYSCVSGAPLRADEATSPDYWARQVRATVQFSRAVQAELSQGDTLFVEVGPGQALTALVRQHRTEQKAPPRVIPLLGTAQAPGEPAQQVLQGLGALWSAGVAVAWPVPAHAQRVALPTYPFRGERHWFKRADTPARAEPEAQAPRPHADQPESRPAMSRLPRLEQELARILSEVSGIQADAVDRHATFLDLGLDSLSLTQATLELEQSLGVKLRFRRLLEDLDTVGKLAQFLDQQLPPDRFAAPQEPAASPLPSLQPVPAALSALSASSASSTSPALSSAVGAMAAPAALGSAAAVHQLIQQQMQLMAQQLAILSGQTVAHALPQPLPAAALPNASAATEPAAQALPTPGIAAISPAPASAEQPSQTALLDKPFGASARITQHAHTDFTPAQQRWLDEFVARYNARTGRSKSFSQDHRKLMADPRVVTGFNPLWKDLVYPIVVDRSKGSRLWDIDGNEYIDLLSCFGANLLGYQPDDLVQAMVAQLQAGIEVGPQHPMAAEVAALIAEFTGMERVAFCNTGSEAVMGAMRMARTVTGRKTIAIFTNSYHGIFDEVVVRGTRQLRSLSAAPGILASAVENVLVLDYASDAALQVLRDRGHELAAIMIEPIQNRYPTLQPREFVQALRHIADQAGCALIFDEVVTGFRVAPGGAQEFYGVRADIATYGKIIGGGLPFAAIAGSAHWLDALDGGHWSFGDGSYPEAGVTYFAGTFVRHPLALAAARATLRHLKQGGRELYRTLNERTQRMVDRLNAAFAQRHAPVKAVHCASLWRLSWDDNLKHVSLFYYLLRLHGLHVYEQFGHFVTEAMSDADTDRIVQVFVQSLDELMGQGLIPPRGGLPPRPDKAPLTPGQTERWLAANFDEHARRALNESVCLSLQGAVQLEALQAALSDVVQRHEAFRTALDAIEPLQSVQASCTLPLTQVDLRDQADADAALDAFCERAGRQDFQLDQPPLARLYLLQLSDGRVVVYLATSHLIFDGWASNVFLTDLAQAYRARCTGQAPQWGEAESPRDFAVQEQARWQGPQAQADLAYWCEQLRNPPPALTLGDLTPTAARSFAGDTARTVIQGPALAALQALARQHKATLFQVMLTVVSQLVQRRTGQHDLVLSIPYASQNLARHAPLIADGVLDLPLRLSCRDTDFTTQLGHVRARLMDALEHPLVTQGSVARALGLPSVGNRPPLTGVFFNFNPRIDLSGFAPWQAQAYEARKLGLLSELIFNFYDTPDAITLDLHHSTEFFSRDRVQALLQDLHAQVERLVTTRTEGLVDPAQRFNATDTAFEPGLRLGDLVRRAVAQQPHALAVRFEGQALTYQQLDQRAWALALHLRSLGVQPGSLVGVCLERSIDLVTALLAVVYSGGAYVPLDPAYPAERLAHMCEDAAMRVIVSRQSEWSRVGARFPAGTPVIDLADHTGPWAAYEALSTADLVLLGSPQDPAYVIFTSGSTGRPKGAMNAHVGIVNRLLWMQQAYPLTPQDRVLQKTPYSFDVSVWEFFWPLMTGACIVVAKPEGHRDTRYLVDLIARDQVSVLHFVPSMLGLFLEDGDLSPCASVRQVMCSGEALPVETVNRFFERLPHARLANLYGPTEAAIDVSHWDCQPHDPRGMVPIGRPVANTRLYVLDEQLKPLPLGTTGELYIGGVQVGMGYVSRPDLTAERFLPDPFQPGGRLYKTGDLARWLPEGVLAYQGRADQQIKLAGNRIELGEIEACLQQHPGVQHAVVLAHAFGPHDVRLVACVVARPGEPAPPDADTLKAHLASQLPKYMIPQHVLHLAQMPLLPNGKTDRKTLDSRVESLLSVDRRLWQWNQTDAPRPPFDRVEQWVSAQAAQTPDAIALQSRGIRLSYRELDQRANRFAHLLMERGVAEGDRVGLCLSRGPDLLAALLGTLKTGAAYVPLDPGFPKDRLHYMAQDAGLHSVITEAAHAHLAGVPRPQQIRIDDDAAQIAAAPADAPQPLRPLSARAVAYVIYTSGSTGQPKGVVLPQSAVCNFLASMQREPGLQAQDHLLAVTTLSFDIAVLELFLPLVTGARVVLAQREDAIDGEALSRLIADENITVMQATPTTWHLLIDQGWHAPAGFKALCGGEPLPPSLAGQLLDQGIELWNLYGPTETTVWSTLTRITDPRAKITIGHPIAQTQVWVLDADMRPCAVGQEGEICIGGEGVALGYFQRPELTAERFVPDPFRPHAPEARLYRTGDLGRWREDGVLEHLGRLDFQVKIRGYRIELGEIEARLAAQPGVARTVVTAREDTPGDVRLVAYLTARPGHHLDTAALRQALKADLPDYMVPQQWMVLDALPLLPNGKIDRKSLPAPQVAAAQATSSLMQSIAHAMAEVLGLPALAPDDHFFELGGHSLLAARLSARLIEQVGHRPSLRTIFEHPTPKLLAAALEQGLPHPAAGGASDVIPRRADRSWAPLSAMQQRLWFLENLNPHTVAHNTPSGHRLIGPLDAAAFDEAFQLLIQRQSVLRTVIEQVQDEARQRILPTLSYPLQPVTDLSAVPPGEREARVQQDIQTLLETPYDLLTGPLFTAHLWRLSANEHIFFLQTHHLIWDGWSFDLFYQDMAELYEACRTKRTPHLPPITIDYGDFAAWHAAWLAGPELARQVDYWRDTLTPLPAPLNLPLDHPRPPFMSVRGGSVQFNLDARTTAILREQAQAQGRTLYVSLLGAFAWALHELCAQDDFVVGTPVRGREHPGLEPLMGFFVNMLPLRMTVKPQMPVNDWLDQVNRQVVAAFAYPDAPFEHLVRALQVPRDPSRSAIYQVAFSYQDVRDRPTHWGNVAHERMATPIVSSAQDLGLWCVETPAHIECLFTYNADVLEAASVSRFGERLQALLQAWTAQAPVAAAAPAPTDEVSALNPTEQTIAEVWSRLLEVSPIRPSDNFFDLGGHSLLAMRAVTEINRRLHAQLTIRQLIFSTLAQLASLASAPPPTAAAEPAAVSPAPPAPRKGWVRHLMGKLTP